MTKERAARKALRTELEAQERADGGKGLLDILTAAAKAMNGGQDPVKLAKQVRADNAKAARAQKKMRPIFPKRQRRAAPTAPFTPGAGSILNITPGATQYVSPVTAPAFFCMEDRCNARATYELRRKLGAGGGVNYILRTCIDHRDDGDRQLKETGGPGVVVEWHTLP